MALAVVHHVRGAGCRGQGRERKRRGLPDCGGRGWGGAGRSKTYTEKVWHIPCSEIRAEWAAQRIKGLSLLTAVKHALVKQRSTGPGAVIKTLIDAFDYPERGPGMMWDTVADIVQRRGGEIRLGAGVERIHREDGKVTDARSGPRLGRKELALLGLAHAADVEDRTVGRMPKAYPMYDSTYRERGIMATTINVPVEVHLITLCIESFRSVPRQVQVGRTTRTQMERVRDVREVPPGPDRDGLRPALDLANRIFLPADIQFTLRSSSAERVAAPDNLEEVNEQGFFALASQFPARVAVSVLVVNKFQGKELGGQAVEQLGVCIVRSLGNPATGKVLAHELGHLLSLGHVTQSGVDNYNLMYPSLRADDRLTAQQIAQARASDLVKRLGAG
jgi:hypothetical protein